MVSIVEGYITDSRWKRDRVVLPGMSLFAHVKYGKNIYRRHKVYCEPDNSKTKVTAQKFEVKNVHGNVKQITYFDPQTDAVKVAYDYPCRTPIPTRQGKVEEQQISHSKLAPVGLPVYESKIISLCEYVRIKRLGSLKPQK